MVSLAKCMRKRDCHLRHSQSPKDFVKLVIGIFSVASYGSCYGQSDNCHQVEQAKVHAVSVIQ